MIIRASLSQELSNYNNRLTSYVASMSYNFSQACVTADPLSLLPINIEMDGEINHLEDLADIVIHNKETDGDDVTIDVFPKELTYFMPCIQGIFTSHPEFKISIEDYEDEETKAMDEAFEKQRLEDPENYDEDEKEMYDLNKKYIRLVMPPVNKNRHDTLLELVKLYRDKCKADLEAQKIRTMATLTPLFVRVPVKEVDKTKENLDKLSDKYNELADKLADDKKKQIEDAYQEYLKRKNEQEANEKAPKKIKL